MGRLLLSMVIFLSITSCVATSVNAYKDPKFSNKTYNSILVFPELEKLAHNSYIEKHMCHSLRRYTDKCIGSMNLFLPTREYSNQDKIDLIIASGAEAIISIRLTDAYSQQSYVPQTSTTTGSVNVSPYSNSATFSSNTSKSGGYYVNKPVREFKVSVFDVQSGEVALVADSWTGGYAGATTNELLGSLSGKLTTTLRNNGLIEMKARKNENNIRSGESLLDAKDGKEAARFLFGNMLGE